MRITSEQDDHGTYTVTLLDKHDLPYETWEDVAEEDVEETEGDIRWNYFSVQDYLELMKNISFEIRYLYLENMEGEDDDEHPRKWRRWDCTITRGDFTWVAPFYTGLGKEEDPSMSIVLEQYLDDSLTVANYGSGPEDLDALDEWASDLGYNQMKKGLSRAIKAWKRTWEAHEKIIQLFTEEELKDIKHAFEEGRRR